MSNSKITMEAIKAKLRENAQSGGQQTKTVSGGEKTAYPFWNIPFNADATIRFLPDADPDNVFFWVKKETIKLPFEGISGGEYETTETVEVTVPSMDMFGGSCPISAHIRPWWKDDTMKPLASVYWKKPTFIFQGFVVQSPFQEEEPPVNPIRKFNLNRGLYEIVEQSLMNPEMEDSPVDYIAGRDFRIRKTQKGEYANYSTSNWSMNTRSLSEVEATAIEQHGLFDLKEGLGAKPDADMIKAMFLDSLNGLPFDHNAYGNAFRAFKKRGGGESTAVINARMNLASKNATSVQVPRQQFVPQTPAQQPVQQAAPESYTPQAQAPVQEQVEQSVAASGGDKPSPMEILERIKNRTNASR